jgi:hypothetical protein
MHPIAGLVLKVGTVGAGFMAGSTIVGEAVRHVSQFADRHLKLGIEPVVSGPLDAIGTLLDPLDLTGIRARKEAKEKEARRRAKERAKREARKRKEAEKNAAAANAAASQAEARAAQAEAQAREAERRANDALARQKRAEAVKQRRWAGMARQAAAKATTEAPKAPDAAADMAKAALELAKMAMSPPANAQQVLSSDMTPQAQSLLADIIDDMNRLGPAPNYEALTERIWEGYMGLPYDDDEGGEIEAGVFGAVDGVSVSGPVGFDDEKPVEETAYYEDNGPMTLAGPETLAGPDTAEVGACCSTCAMGGTCEGSAKGRVEAGYLDGSIIQGDDDDDEDVGEGDYLDGPDDDDDVGEGDEW